jgi:hypothetical protein
MIYIRPRVSFEQSISWVGLHDRAVTEGRKTSSFHQDGHSINTRRRSQMRPKRIIRNFEPTNSVPYMNDRQRRPRRIFLGAFLDVYQR